MRLGVIGASEGNGHPFSWSALFNGYDSDLIRNCGYPLIFDYLSDREFPREFISGARVTHVWSQSVVEAKKIANATFIENVVTDPRQMISAVDAVLFARDDFENTFELVSPLISSGLPIYIDKPAAISVKGFDRLTDLEKYVGQIFTCSAMRYARELDVGSMLSDVGRVTYVVAHVPNSWEKYAIHMIEPALKIFGPVDIPDFSSKSELGSLKTNVFDWKFGLRLQITTTGNTSSPFHMRVHGDLGYRDVFFNDWFYMFKEALTDFLRSAKASVSHEHRSLSRRAIEILELGN